MNRPIILLLRPLLIAYCLIGVAWSSTSWQQAPRCSKTTTQLAVQQIDACVRDRLQHKMVTPALLQQANTACELWLEKAYRFNTMAYCYRSRANHSARK